MSEFEFVSVAVALLFSIAVGRLLGSISDVFDPRRRYAVHAGWVIYLLLYSAIQWWNFYANGQGHDFRPATFLFALSIPSFVVVRANLLLGRPGQVISSYREHFYAKRVPFFSVGLASMILLMIAPWVMGRSAPGEISTQQIRGAPFLFVWLVGLISSNPSVHTTLIAIMLPLAAGFFLADAFTVR